MLDSHEHVTSGVHHCQRESSDNELVVGVGRDEVGGDDGKGVDDDDHEYSHSDEFVVGGCQFSVLRTIPFGVHRALPYAVLWCPFRAFLLFF